MYTRLLAAVLHFTKNARRHSKLPTFCYILPDLSLEVVNHILSLDVMVRDEKWVPRHSSLCTTHPNCPVGQVAAFYTKRVQCTSEVYAHHREYNQLRTGCPPLCPQIWQSWQHNAIDCRLGKLWQRLRRAPRVPSWEPLGGC